jgi:hypothetical protein
MGGCVSRISNPPTLAEVRRALDTLVERRLLGPLSQADRRRWVELTDLEEQLLLSRRAGRDGVDEDLAPAS